MPTRQRLTKTRANVRQHVLMHALGHVKGVETKLAKVRVEAEAHRPDGLDNTTYVIEDDLDASRPHTISHSPARSGRNQPA